MSFDLLEGHRRDLGGSVVDRVLLSPRHRAVGPFVFFDHVAPIVLSDEGLRARPHPHIGLATVTVLCHGESVHRDRLGTVQTIRPGDVDWMTAGHGIVHSASSRRATTRLVSRQPILRKRRTRPDRSRCRRVPTPNPPHFDQRT